MASIKFIHIETHKPGDPLDLSLVTYRFLRASDTEKQRAAKPLGRFTENPKTINQSYDFEKGISVALYDGDDDQVGEWRWVNDQPTGRRLYLEFRRDGGWTGTDRYYKVLYDVRAAAPPRETPPPERDNTSAGATEAAVPRHAPGSDAANAREPREPASSTNRPALRRAAGVHGPSRADLIESAGIAYLSELSNPTVSMRYARLYDYLQYRARRLAENMTLDEFNRLQNDEPVRDDISQGVRDVLSKVLGELRGQVETLVGAPGLPPGAAQAVEMYELLENDRLWSHRDPNWRAIITRKIFWELVRKTAKELGGGNINRATRINSMLVGKFSNIRGWLQEHWPEFLEWQDQNLRPEPAQVRAAPDNVRPLSPTEMTEAIWRSFMGD